MERRETNQRVSKTLKFSEIYNDSGKFSGGGILNSTNAIEDEMWIEIMDDLVLDPKDDRWKSTGRLQIHLGSTKRALEQLGTFLLALSRYQPPQSGYTASFELKDKDENPILHLVFHLPNDQPNKREKFARIHNIASAQISNDGTQIIDTTLPPKDG